MDWSFYVAAAVIVIMVASLVPWRPKRQDALDEAIERYLHERKD